MKIREIVERDRADWVRLREALWPGSLSDHDAETRRYFEKLSHDPIIFVAEVDRESSGSSNWTSASTGLVAAPRRCRSSRAGTSEPGLQRHGIGRALIEAAEEYARAAGHHEIGSDAESENPDGIAAHLALGYEEVERVVFSGKSLSNT